MSEGLTARGIIVLPETIEHGTYVMMAEALLTRPAEDITLYCAGNGGSVRAALAIVDLIQWHGAVSGVLLGAAVSAHGMIWAACAKRFVGPHGMLGVHKAGYAEFNRAVDSKSAEQLIAELEFYERSLARILAAAGERDAAWWYKTIQDAGSDGYTMFPAATLLSSFWTERWGTWPEGWQRANGGSAAAVAEGG